MNDVPKFLYLTLILILSGCSTIEQGPVSINPSFDDMSLALRVMSLTGNDEYFVDVDSQYYSETLNGEFDATTPVADILASAGFFTDKLGFSNSKLLSNNQAGGLQLALGVFESAHRKANLNRLDYRTFAWIPISQAANEEEAQQIFFQAVDEALRVMEGEKASELRVNRIQRGKINGVDYFTEEKMYLQGKGLFEQGTYKDLGLPKKAHVYIQDPVLSYRDPTGNSEESFFIQANFFIWNSDTENNQKRIVSDLIEFARLMPDWYYQFLFIDKVPVVLTPGKINLFMKPKKNDSLETTALN